ncbi:MAG: DNA replication/repair protein RecF [Lentisphaeria bacterium]|nr:DNA replication/repair protein RecF [Lentisphaeria bacterium]
MAILKQLYLNNFRNFESLDIEFSAGINVFVGDNGQGKSNLLEAVYFLSILRSFRTNKVQNIYRWDTTDFIIRGQIKNASGEEKAALQYNSQKRQLRLNGEPVNKASDFIGRFFAVAFVPEDIELVKGSAGDRRRFLDITLTQLYPDYLSLLQNYDKGLKARNKLLRKGTASLAQIQAFDQVIIPKAAAIMNYRREFFGDFKEKLNTSAHELQAEGDKLKLKYEPSISFPKNNGDLIEHIQNQFTASLEKDFQRGMTQAGPHRDDFQVLLNGRQLHRFGSEGQCRLAAICIKLAKASFLLEEKNEKEIILLVDDVIGELDNERLSAFYKSLQRVDQVFLACTSEEHVRNLEIDQIYYVEDGQITKERNLP